MSRTLFLTLPIPGASSAPQVPARIAKPEESPRIATSHQAT